jgi:phosphoglycerate dehydrogenase-like enzyme
MDNHNILVLADPTEPQLAMLEALPPDTGIAVGRTAEAFARAAGEADIIFNWSGSGALLRQVFCLCPRLRWVHNRSAGLEDVLFPELIESPVPLTNGSGVFSAPLAEFVLGAILYFAQNFRRLIRNQMAGVWEPGDITEIGGRTAGIVGYGDIGRSVATRLGAVGMHLVALRRQGSALYHADPLVNRFYGHGGLAAMVAQCQYLVVAAPLTPETRGMIGAAEFAAMKPDTVVINVGRGPVIDEQAMIQALAEKRILGAALDVFDVEPLPPGHPFYQMDNVLLSPHAADHTPDWLERAMQFFLAQFERFAKGEPLRNVVDKQRGY